MKIDYNEKLLARLFFDPAGLKNIIIKIPKETYLKLMELCKSEKIDLPNLLDKLIEHYVSSIRHNNET